MIDSDGLESTQSRLSDFPKAEIQYCASDAKGAANIFARAPIANDLIRYSSGHHFKKLVVKT
jgi:hypothetical protein